MTTKILIVALTAIGLSIGGRAQNVNIPDANFKSLLLGNAAINTNGDNEISVAEAAAYTGTISVGYSSIADLTGIEAFTALTQLECYGNSLTSLNVSNNTSLTVLRCYRNSIANLDLSNNTALIELSCNNNSLTNLDISNNVELTNLSCANNSLTSLDLSNNTSLNNLHCEHNLLTSLDLSNNTALTSLYCTYNSLTSMDLSNNTALNTLRCDGNSLSTLDLSNNTALVWLSCYSNSLTSLNLPNSTALTDLYCTYNLLTSIDVSKNTALTSLNCFGNKLTNIDVSSNTALIDLDCGDNKLANLDLSNNTELISLGCSMNPLTTLDVSKNTALNRLDCDYGSLTSLDVSNNTALKELYCSNNSLTSLDISNNQALTLLWCDHNSLRSLNLQNGNNSKLQDFDATYNSNLRCILVSDAAYMNSHFAGSIDASASFYETSCPQCTISTMVIPDNSGTVTGAGNYNLGELVTLTAIPEPGYDFTMWKITGYEVSTNTAYSFTATADWVVVANFTPATGIDDVNVVQTLVLYPNPSAGKFALELNSSYSGNITIKICAAGGSTIKEFQVSKPAGKLIYPVDLGNVAAGVYYIDITTANEKTTKMMVVNR